MAYLFSYFTGEQPQGEQIYFSLSRDGLFWQDLHQGKPVIRSGVGECGMRDPFLIRKEDGSGFVIVATDLCIAAGKGWKAAEHEGSRSLVVTESPDLVHWTEPALVEVSVLQAGCTWAPEAIYDRQSGDYLVFWASMVKLEGDEKPKQRIYSARTRDFHTFSGAELFLERENHVIDSTIVYSDGVYYRFSKDETDKVIRVDAAPDLKPDSFREVSVPALAGLYGVEGPEVYYLRERGQWCLIVDRFASRQGYLPLVCDSLERMEFRILEDAEFSMGSTMKRHGGVAAITDAEYERMAKAFGM